MSRTKFMGIFLVILGVISVVVGIIRGDMTSSAAMFIGYLVPALLGAVILIVDHIGGGETKKASHYDIHNVKPFLIFDSIIVNIVLLIVFGAIFDS